MSSPQTCPKCGAPVRPGARFCTSCGQALSAAPPAARSCPRCGQANRADSHYCAYCRASLDPAPQPPAGRSPHGRRRLRKRVWVIASLGLALIVAGGVWIVMAAGTGGSASRRATPATETVAPVPTPTLTAGAGTIPVGTEPGQRAPDFALRDLEGKMHHLADYRGQTLILGFWATSCSACREQLLILQTVSDKYASHGLSILALDQGEPAGKVASFRRRNEIALTVLLDTQDRAGDDYGVDVLPTLYFVGRDGLVQSKRSGPATQAEVEAEVESLLAQVPLP